MLKWMQSGYLKWRRPGGCSNWTQILDGSGHQVDIESGGKWRLGWRKLENKVEIEVKTRGDPGGPKWTIKRKLSGRFFGALKPRQTETQADQSGTLKVETKWTKVEHWS